VICSDADALPEVIEHEKTGLMFPVNNREELTKAMVRLYENKDLAQRLASNAQTEAARRFCEENKNDLLNIYQKAIDICTDCGASQKDGRGES
jgi:glycosyltransferase involved in cell wall biosynthesis